MKKTKPVMKMMALVLCLSFLGAMPATAASVTNDLQPQQTLESIIQDVRGGLGVKATISNYQLAWGNRPVHWQLTIEGERVIFGSASGYVDSMSASVARSPLIPPAFGWGPVDVTIKVTVRTGQPDEGVISMVQRSGVMFGPFILLI